MRAVVRVLPVMHHHLVPLQGAELCEPQPARVTNVWLLSRVNQEVSVEGLFKRKAFLALRTHEHRTISRVHEPLVPSHLKCLAEALATELALVGLLLVVHLSVVSPQGAFP